MKALFVSSFALACTVSLSYGDVRVIGQLGHDGGTFFHHRTKNSVGFAKVDGAPFSPAVRVDVKEVGSRPDMDSINVLCSETPKVGDIIHISFRARVPSGGRGKVRAKFGQATIPNTTGYVQHFGIAQEWGRYRKVFVLDESWDPEPSVFSLYLSDVEQVLEVCDVRVEVGPFKGDREPEIWNGGVHVTEGEISRYPIIAEDRSVDRYFFSMLGDSYGLEPDPTDSNGGFLLNCEVSKAHATPFGAGFLARNTTPLKKGEPIDFSFEVRCLRGENKRARLSPMFHWFDPPHQRSFEHQVSIGVGEKWLPFRFRFRARDDYFPGEAKAGFAFGHAAQHLQIRNFRVRTQGAKEPLISSGSFYETFAFFGAEYATCLQGEGWGGTPSFQVDVRNPAPAIENAGFVFSPPVALQKDDEIEIQFQVARRALEGRDLKIAAGIVDRNGSPMAAEDVIDSFERERGIYTETFRAEGGAPAGSWRVRLSFGDTRAAFEIGAFSISRIERKVNIGGSLSR